MVNLKSKIYVAGHNGLVGSAIVRQLKKKGYKKIITANRSTLDLTNQTKVLKFLKKKKIKRSQPKSKQAEVHLRIQLSKQIQKFGN